MIRMFLSSSSVSRQGVFQCIEGHISREWLQRKLAAASPTELHGIAGSYCYKKAGKQRFIS